MCLDRDLFHILCSHKMLYNLRVLPIPSQIWQLSLFKGCLLVAPTINGVAPFPQWPGTVPAPNASITVMEAHHDWGIGVQDYIDKNYRRLLQMHGESWIESLEGTLNMPD